MGNERNLINMKWTPEEHRTLQSMWEAGYTASDIGKSLGRGKNAVIGAAHRLGLSQHINAPVPKAKRDQVPKKRRNPAENLPITIKKVVPMPIPVPNKQPPKPKVDAVPILKLTPRSCRAVVSDHGGPGGLALYCGEATEESVPFCEYHCSIFYQPKGYQSERNRRRNHPAG